MALTLGQVVLGQVPDPAAAQKNPGLLDRVVSGINSGYFNHASSEAMVASILLRLHAGSIGAAGLTHLHCAKEGDKVFVFGVAKGQPVTFVEDWELYPSDQLITQLRLLRG